VVAIHLEALSQVKSVRRLSGYPRDQVQLSASLRTSLPLKPSEEPCTVPERSRPFVRDKVVNGKDAAAVEHAEQTVASDRAHRSLVHQCDKPVAVGRHNRAYHS